MASMDKANIATTIVCCSPLDPGMTQEEADATAGVFKALADPARLRLLSLLAANGEMCGCDLEGPLGLSQPTVSHHLRVLSQAGLIIKERRGQWVYARISADALSSLSEALSPKSRKVFDTRAPVG